MRNGNSGIFNAARAAIEWYQDLRRPSLDAEMTPDSDSVFRQWSITPYSPDRLVRRKGFKIFKEMARDDQIAQSLNALKTMRLSTGWEVKPWDEEDPESVRQAEFITWVFDNIEGSFRDDLWELMSAVDCGWSMSEKIHTLIEEGEWKGLIGLKALKAKNQENYNLDVNEFNDIKEDGVVSLGNADYSKRYPRDKFVIYSYRKQNEDVFGTPLLRSLYDLWWIKTVLKRALGVTMERYGMPFLVGRYGSTFDKAAQDDLFNALKTLKFDSATVIPKEAEILIQEDQGRSSGKILEAIKHIDEQIVKTILGQTLTQSQGDRGSQALGKVHFNILELYLQELGEDVSTKAINEQVIKELITLNFPGVTNFPSFGFRPMGEDDPIALYAEYIKGVDMGVIIPTEEDEKHYRNVIKAPERTEEATLLPKGELAVNPPPPPVPGQFPGKQPPKKKEDKDEERLSEEQRQAVVVGFASQNEPFKKTSRKRLFTGTGKRELSQFEKKVNYQEMLSIVEDTGVEDTVALLEPVLRKSLDSIYKQIERSGMIAEQNSKLIKQLKFTNMGDIRRVLTDSLTRTAKAGERTAQTEVAAAKNEERLQDLSSFDNDDVLRYLKDTGFQMTGNITGQMQSIIEVKLFNSIKNGQSLKNTISGIETALAPFMGAAGDKISGPRLETVIRTNTTSAFNMARKESFLKDTEFVIGMEYSAILDDRVRPNHAKMDGKIFRTDNPIWDTWTPSNGYNCRCMLIPVTKGEGWNGIESKAPAVQPDKDFGAV